MRRFTIGCPGVVIVLLAGGCATLSSQKKSDPGYWLTRACEPGEGIRQVNGSVWLKANSKEASGQFPASISVTAPSTLQMEVTNLVGGTEALVRVNRDEYSIEIPGKKKSAPQSQKGYGTWGGIPLRWSTDLFLGRIPCPPAESFKTLRPQRIGEEGLKVEVPEGLGLPTESFEYHFRVWLGEAWPDSLVWTRGGSMPVRVEFKFEEPEDLTRSPRKWEAKSDQGEVKVRWRERNVSR